MPDAPLELAGIKARAGEQQPYYLWPEHERGFGLFLSLVTRWREGFNGPIGLDYVEMHREIERACAKGYRRSAAQARLRLESELRAAERGALQGWSQTRKEREKQREREREEAARRR